MPLLGSSNAQLDHSTEALDRALAVIAKEEIGGAQPRADTLVLLLLSLISPL